MQPVYTPKEKFPKRSAFAIAAGAICGIITAAVAFPVVDPVARFTAEAVTIGMPFVRDSSALFASKIGAFTGACLMTVGAAAAPALMIAFPASRNKRQNNLG